VQIELGALQRAQQGLLGPIEEIEALESLAVDLLRPDQFVQRTMTGGEVIQSGEIVEMTPPTLCSIFPAPNTGL